MIKARHRRGQIDNDFDFGDEFLTITQTADKLKISRATVFELFKKGLKRVVISTRVIRVNPHHLSEFVSQRVVSSKRES